MKAFAFAAVLAAVVYANVVERPGQTPQERATELTQCFGEYFGIDQEITVRFTDEVRWGNPCVGGKGPNSECILGGWAYPLDHPYALGKAIVTYYRPWVENTCDLCAVPTEDKHLVGIVAHEVSHVSGNHGETETWAASKAAVKESTCR